MMERFVEMMINVNIRAAVVICVVLLLRLLFSKLQISKKYVNLLWLLPYLCMVLPWRLESSFSFWGIFPGYESTMEYSDQYDGSTPESLMVHISQDDVQKADVVAEGESDIENAGQNRVTDMEQEKPFDVVSAENVIVLIWLAGINVIVVYSIISYAGLRKKVVCSMCVQDNIYFADDISVPFVLGVMHPRIYLPSGRKQENLEYVLEHEKTHILRRDPLKKAAAFLITGIHWFNPLAWIAFYFLGKDMEMACDEETIWRIGLHKKQDYADTLLRMTSGKRVFSGPGVPLAFGEGDIKGRIHNILKYKRTAGVVAGVALVVTGALCAVFLTDPKNTQNNIQDDMEKNTVQDDMEKNTMQDDAEKGEIELPPSAEQINITTPVVSQEMIAGADGPVLDYASEDTVIFHDYYGLFVYRLDEGIIGAIDLEAIGCNYTQGDNACEVLVEQDGSKVYMHVMDETDMYVYDVKQVSLYKQEYNADTIDEFFKLKDISDCIDPDYTVLRSRHCVAIRDYHYLESGSGLPIDLAWVAVDSQTQETKWYIKLFENDREDSGDTVSLKTEPEYDKVCIRIQPSMVRESVSYYYIPTGSEQEYLKEMLENIEPDWQPFSRQWEGHKETGWYIAYNGMEYMVFEGGYLYATTTEGDVQEYCKQHQELCDTIQQMLNAIDYRLTDVSDIKDIVSAKLDIKGILTDGESFIGTITEEESLDLLETWFQNAEYIYGGTGCGNEDACLELTLAGGEVIRLSMATDDCTNFSLNGVYYDYRPEEYRVTGGWYSENFFELFGVKTAR